MNRRAPACLPPATVAVFLVFGLFGAWPTPDSNESAYLPQARHYVDPGFCRGDVFLESPPPHRLFCQFIGPIAARLPLEAVAWLGRITVWLLLARAWTSIAGALRLSSLSTTLGAVLFLFLNYLCQAWGEWVVGGFEAKGFAWVLVWFAVAARLRGDLPRALGLAGLATAWHVLVGGWSIIVFLLSVDRRDVQSLRTRIKPWVVWSVVGAAGAILGLQPALNLDHAVATAVRDAAARIYVFECCPFHLLPEGVLPVRVAAFTAQLVLWCVLMSSLGGGLNLRQRRLRRIAIGSLALAAVGIALRLVLIDDPTLTARIMRYYWFRTVDVFLPMSTALVAAARLARTSPVGGPLHRRLHRAAIAGSIVFLGALCVYRLIVPTARSEKDLSHPDDFHRACVWVRESTPDDVVVLTPPYTQTFHWFGRRAEVATWKDLPHDAPGVVAWRERVGRVAAAYDAAFANSETATSADAPSLPTVAREYGAAYVICPADPRLPLERVGPTGGYFAVYRVAPEVAVPATGATRR